MTVKWKRSWLRLALLAFLPFLAAATLLYALSPVPWLHVVGIGADGERVIYVHTTFTPVLSLDSKNRVSRHELVVRDGEHERRESVAMAMNDSVALSFDQQLLVVGDPNGRVTIYDAASLQPLRHADLLPTKFVARSLAFSRNNQYLHISAAELSGDAWRLLIVDVATMKITQELGPGELLRDSGGLPYRLVHHILQPGKTPPYGMGQVVEFEQGQLQPIADAPEQLRTSYSASLRFAVDTSKSPQFLLWDREEGTSQQLVIPDSHYPLFSPNSDQLVVLSVGDVVSVVDPETANVVRSWNLDAERIDAALSPEESWAAISNAAGEIEVWDYSSGVRKHKISDGLIERRLYWAMAVPGVVLWCLAWLAVGWRERRTAVVLRDMGILSAVAGASSFFHLLYLGFQNAISRPAAIVAMTMLIGSSVLLALWLVFGPTRWSRRLSVALLGLAAIWAGPLWVWSRYPLPENPVAINTALVVLLLVFLMLLLRWFRFVVVRPESLEMHTRQPAQMTLRDLLFIPAAVGVLLLVGRMVYLPIDVSWVWLAIFAVLPPFQVLLIGIAVWAALSTGGVALRWTSGLGAILLLCLVFEHLLSYVTHPSWEHIIRWWIVSQATISLYVFLCLSMLRRCGWRLQKASQG